MLDRFEVEHAAMAQDDGSPGLWRTASRCFATRTFRMFVDPPRPWLDGAAGAKLVEAGFARAERQQCKKSLLSPGTNRRLVGRGAGGEGRSGDGYPEARICLNIALTLPSPGRRTQKT